MTEGDLDFLAAMLGDAEVMAYYPKTLSRDEARGWLERQRARYAADGHGLWLVERKENGAPVGQVGLVMQEIEGERLPEIGWMIHRRFWRRGYASEAALAARAAAFGRFGYPRVISLIRPENVPSQGVARKLGMAPLRETTFVGLRHAVWGVARDSGAPASPPDPRPATSDP
jgi:RimJ/RimL family protein N-acetyltransferase